MDQKEIYIVVTMDGKAYNMVDYTIAQVVEKLGEKNIFSITKLFYQGDNNE